MDPASTRNLELQNAVRLGDGDAVSNLLNGGADVNYKNDENQTSLHIAAVSDNVVITRLLFQQGAVCSVTDASGSTPLQLALRRGHDANASLLISLMDVITLANRDVYGLTYLHLAVRLSDSRQIENRKNVEKLLAKGVAANNESYSGRSLMEEAARLQDESIFAALSRRLADPIFARQPRDETWGKLRAIMIQTLADPNGLSIKLRLEAYNTVFNLIIKNRPDDASDLYNNIFNCIADSVREIRSAAARVETQQLSAFYHREWQKYKKATKRHAHCFRYLERMWITRELANGKTNIYGIETLHNLLWKNRFYDEEERLKGLIPDMR